MKVYTIYSVSVQTILKNKDEKYKKKRKETSILSLDKRYKVCLKDYRLTIEHRAQASPRLPMCRNDGYSRVLTDSNLTKRLQAFGNNYKDVRRLEEPILGCYD